MTEPFSNEERKESDHMMFAQSTERRVFPGTVQVCAHTVLTSRALLKLTYCSSINICI